MEAKTISLPQPAGQNSLVFPKGTAAGIQVEPGKIEAYYCRPSEGGYLFWSGLVKI